MTTLLQDDKTLVHQQIVERAVLAPSAENAQPWHFHCDGDRLTLFLDRQQEFASDVDLMLTLTGLGASLENAVIAARKLGYEPEIEVEKLITCDAGERYTPVASLVLANAGERDPLYSYLGARCTCRRMDGKQPIADEVRQRLSTGIERFPAAKIDWLSSPAEIEAVSHLIGMGNRIRFEHEPFHDELYHHLRFTPAEAATTRDGLDVATLQLPRGVAWIMWLLRKWSRMRVANVLGFSRAVARQAAQEVRSSCAVGILTVDEATVGDFLAGGRAFQRLWLTATSLGLALHPTASLAVFLAHAERTDLGQLLPRHAEMACDMVDRFYRLCPSLRGRVVQMMFRLGHAASLAVRSLPRPVSSVLDFK